MPEGQHIPNVVRAWWDIRELPSKSSNKTNVKLIVTEKLFGLISPVFPQVPVSIYISVFLHCLALEMACKYVHQDVSQL